MTEAVIVVPGIMGSVLKDGNDLVWPGSLLQAILVPYNKMAQLMKPALTATDIIRDVSIVSQYSNLIDALEACGFREGGAAPTLKVYPYDWRKDNAVAAAGLADCVDGLAAALGADCQINLVAHSMGGLVSRYYLESGDYDGRPGFKAIRRLITLATPHRGAPLALTAAIGEEKRAFLSRAQVKQLASSPHFPSLYQLLPPEGEPFVWDRADTARFAPLDVYGASLAARLGLVTENLDSARAFRAKLDLAKRPSQVRYVAFVGTRQETIGTVQLTVPAAGTVRATKIAYDDGGDGTVPTWSGAPQGVQTMLVGGSHGTIYKQSELKKALGVLLGRPGVLLAAGLVPELSVLPEVAAPDQEVRVTIDLPRNTTTVNGGLALVRLIDSTGTAVAPAPAKPSFPVSYSGAPIDHLAVLITAPSFAGIYGLELVDANGALTAKTELIVQADA